MTYHVTGLLLNPTGLGQGHPRSDFTVKYRLRVFHVGGHVRVYKIAQQRFPIVY
jgi:hypothetical protein